jgi:hypothetical protein
MTHQLPTIAVAAGPPSAEVILVRVLMKMNAEVPRNLHSYLAKILTECEGYQCNREVITAMRRTLGLQIVEAKMTVEESKQTDEHCICCIRKSQPPEGHQPSALNLPRAYATMMADRRAKDTEAMRVESISSGAPAPESDDEELDDEELYQLLLEARDVESRVLDILAKRRRKTFMGENPNHL